MLTEDVMLPPLSLYSKDHKSNAGGVAGTPWRPFANAKKCPNAWASDLAAEVLNLAADAEKSVYECPSTEALQSKIEELNKRLNDQAYTAW